MGARWNVSCEKLLALISRKVKVRVDAIVHVRDLVGDREVVIDDARDVLIVGVGLGAIRGVEATHAIITDDGGKSGTITGWIADNYVLLKFEIEIREKF